MTHVYVALTSHASYFSSGINPRGFYPDDYHRGSGYQVRPALEIVTQTTPLMAWRGKWGASSSSPIAPRRQSKWGDPNAFNATASACTVGPTFPAPRLTVTRILVRRETRPKTRFGDLLPLERTTASPLDWVIVPATGDCVAAPRARISPAKAISHADCAVVLVTAATESQWVRQVVNVGRP